MSPIRRPATGGVVKILAAAGRRGDMARTDLDLSLSHPRVLPARPGGCSVDLATAARPRRHRPRQWHCGCPQCQHERGYRVRQCPRPRTHADTQISPAVLRIARIVIPSRGALSTCPNSITLASFHRRLIAPGRSFSHRGDRFAIFRYTSAKKGESLEKWGVPAVAHWAIYLYCDIRASVCVYLCVL